jgi:hypothetical protein
MFPIVLYCEVTLGVGDGDGVGVGVADGTVGLAVLPEPPEPLQLIVRAARTLTLKANPKNDRRRTQMLH